MEKKTSNARISVLRPDTHAVLGQKSHGTPTLQEINLWGESFRLQISQKGTRSQVLRDGCYMFYVTGVTWEVLQVATHVHVLLRNLLRFADEDACTHLNRSVLGGSMFKRIMGGIES